jgi:hypothetical protein
VVLKSIKVRGLVVHGVSSPTVLLSAVAAPEAAFFLALACFCSVVVCCSLSRRSYHTVLGRPTRMPASPAPVLLLRPCPGTNLLIMEDAFLLLLLLVEVGVGVGNRTRQLYHLLLLSVLPLLLRRLTRMPASPAPVLLLRPCPGTNSLTWRMCSCYCCCWWRWGGGWQHD